jgi:hypothetical protein
MDGEASFSKYTASSRASARGLLWKLWVAARLDLLRRRRALEVDLPQIDSKWLQQRWVKNPKGFGFYL